MRKLFSALLVLTILLGTLSSVPFTVNAATTVTVVTQSEAKKWLEDRVGERISNPLGGYEGECASLAAQYYAKLMGRIVYADNGKTGHGYQFADNNHSVNLGWSRGTITANTVLALGDVIVTGHPNGSTGNHVAIFYSGTATNACQIESAPTLTNGITTKTNNTNLVGLTYVRPVWKIVPNPTTVLSVKVTGSQVTVNWSVVSNTSYYDVYLLQAPWGWNDIKYSATSYGTSYTFTNVANGDYAAFVITRPNDNYSAQSNWYSFKVTTTTSANIANGVYRIQGLGSGKYVDIKDGSLANGAVAHLWQSALVNNQKFRFERLLDGTYKITAVHSGRSLEVRNSGMNNGDQVAQWDFDANYACKRWYVVDCGNGYYKFVNKNSNKVLDVSGNGTANGTKIQQWQDNGTSAQRFKLIPA